MYRLLALIEMLYKGSDAIFEMEHIFFVDAVILEGNVDSGVEIRHLTNSLEQRIVVKINFRKDFLVRPERYFRAAFFGFFALARKGISNVILT